MNGNCVCAAGWGEDDCSQCVRYVRAGAVSGNGTSWAQAVFDISDALARWPTCQIWVYQGSYVPAPGTGTDPRTGSFVIPSGAKVYGGFSGSETSLAERDLAHHTSTLSGDLGIANDASDNAYHVVTLGDGALLDGFTITDGNSNGDTPNDTGSAVYASGTTGSVSNCTMSGSVGAATSANVTLSDCVFSPSSFSTQFSRGTLSVSRCTFNDSRVGGRWTKVTMTDSAFVGQGAGFTISGDGGLAQISDTRFTGNSTALSAGSAGAAITLARVTIESAEIALNLARGSSLSGFNSKFLRNSAVATLHEATVTLDGCMLMGNDAGFYLPNSEAHRLNSVFVGNTGTLLDISGDTHAADFANCTFYDNALEMKLVRPIVTIRSSIFWKNRTPPPVQVAVTYSEIDNPSAADPTNFSGDPMFVSTTPGALDFRLRAGSPCIDRAPSGSPELDALGHERYDDPGSPNLNGTITDLGAYEWRPE